MNPAVTRLDIRLTKESAVQLKVLCDYYNETKSSVIRKAIDNLHRSILVNNPELIHETHEEFSKIENKE